MSGTTRHIHKADFHFLRSVTAMTGYGKLLAFLLSLGNRMPEALALLEAARVAIAALVSFVQSVTNGGQPIAMSPMVEHAISLEDQEQEKTLLARLPAPQSATGGGAAAPTWDGSRLRNLWQVLGPILTPLLTRLLGG